MNHLSYSACQYNQFNKWANYCQFRSDPCIQLNALNKWIHLDCTRPLFENLRSQNHNQIHRYSIYLLNETCYRLQERTFSETNPSPKQYSPEMNAETKPQYSPSLKCMGGDPSNLIIQCQFDQVEESTPSNGTLEITVFLIKMVFHYNNLSKQFIIFL